MTEGICLWSSTSVSRSRVLRARHALDAGLVADRIGSGRVRHVEGTCCDSFPKPVYGMASVVYHASYGELGDLIEALKLKNEAIVKGPDDKVYHDEDERTDANSVSRRVAISDMNRRTRLSK